MVLVTAGGDFLIDDVPFFCFGIISSGKDKEEDWEEQLKKETECRES